MPTDLTPRVVPAGTGPTHAPNLQQLATQRGQPGYFPVPSKNPWDFVAGAYNWWSYNTRRGDQGLGRAMLGGVAGVGGQDERVIIGDSISAGATAKVGATYMFDRLRAWPLAMRDQLANAGIPANGTGLVRLVDGGAGFDARLAFSGTWTGFQWGTRTTVPGSFYTFSPEKSGNYVDILYYDQATSTITISVDGAVAGTGFRSLTTGSSNTWKTARVYGVDVIANVSTIKVTVTATTVGCYLAAIGVMVANGGLIVHNFAQSGASASGTGNASWSDPATIINVFKDAGGRKRTVANAGCTVGSPNLDSATAAFTDDDLGKSIDELNIGSAGRMFPDGVFIGQRNSGTQVVMYRGTGANAVPVNAYQTLTNQQISIGRDPSCIDIALGLNDLISLGASDSAITAGITTIRNYWPNSDVILHLLLEANPTLVSGPRFITFQQAMVAHADTLDCPMYDHRDRIGTFANGQAIGVYGDADAHITSATSGSLGAGIARLWGTGSGRAQTVGDPEQDNDVVNRGFIVRRRKHKANVAVALGAGGEAVFLKMPIPPGKFKVDHVLQYLASVRPSATTVLTYKLRIGPLGTTADAAVVTMAATAATNAGPRVIDGISSILQIGGASVHFGHGSERVGAISAAGTATATVGTFVSTQTNYVTLCIQSSAAVTVTMWAAVLEWLGDN